MDVSLFFCIFAIVLLINQMKKFFLLFFVALVSLPHVLNATPAYPVRKTLTLQDGSKVEVTLAGDEHLSYYLARDGRAFRQVQNNRFEVVTREELSLLMRAAAHDKDNSNTRRASRLKRRVGGVSSGLTGTKKGLVILVRFNDNDFQPAHDRDFYRRYFNEEGFSEGGFMGCVADYFRAQSYNEFNLDFDVVGPYTLSKGMAAYGAPEENRNDCDPQGMAWEAMQLANADVDYTNYDWDHDGEVDQVFIIYAGYGEAQSDMKNTIWPHESSVAHFGNTMLDGVKLATYGCGCELQGASGTVADGIGTAVHEFSHCLGLPDMYDIDYSGGYAMAHWDVMSQGSYNGTRGLYGICPAAYTSYERWQAGWLEPVELTQETEIKDMKPLTSAPEAYILYNSANRNEYYLLENRQQEGFDRYLYGHGLLVLHVDYDALAWNGNAVNDDPNHQRMNVIPADNSFGNSNSDEAGDAYPGTTNNTSLTDRTVPASTLFKINRFGRKFMEKPIEGIRESAEGTISFIVMQPELVAPDAHVTVLSPTSFSVSWEKVNRAVSYELTMTEYPSKSTPEDAILLKETFAKCVTQSAGFSDIGNKLASYTDNTGFSGNKLYTSPNGLKLGTATSVGTLKTSWISTPSTGELTYVLGVVPGTEGKEVKGTLQLVLNNVGPVENLTFAFDKSGYIILHTGRPVEDYTYASLLPNSVMYLNYLAVYDGNFSADELGLTALNEEVSRAKVPRRLNVKTLTTSDTSVTFTDLVPTSRYELLLRSKDNQRISEWSAPLNVYLTPTGIHGVSVTGSLDASYYDMQGREVQGVPTRGVYIHKGKKFLKR